LKGRDNVEEDLDIYRKNTTIGIKRNKMRMHELHLTRSEVVSSCRLLWKW